MATTGDSASNALAQDLAARLAPFLATHPNSRVGQLPIPTLGSAVPQLGVLSPWGDDSLAIRVPPGQSEELIEALNNLYLPERFTAIWHKDTGAFEIIYSLLPREDETASRAFLFRHRGHDYDCQFADSSERLLLLAANHLALTGSATQFRNLIPFQLYLAPLRIVTIAKESGAVAMRDLRPTSFWIRGIEWNSDAVRESALKPEPFGVLISTHTRG